MVPHLKVEEAVLRASSASIPARSPAFRTSSAANAWSCCTRAPTLTPAELWQQLSDTDLPKLWLPKRENIYQVDSIPTLGTGKLDLRGVKLKAQQLAAQVRVQADTQTA